jgi:DNA-directed RNA polymerase specialized sigma24 family protein
VETTGDDRAEAFSRLYDRDAPLVTRFARAALGNDAAAQDVCAEVQSLSMRGKAIR